MAAVKGSANEKRLASQFIAKFFSKFPEHADASLEAILDLCEDEDVAIRKQAIRDLPIICKESPDFVPKITDILAQLIVTDDPTELLMVNSSLLTLYRLQPKGFLSGLFSQIENGEEVTRERSIKFLVSKLRSIPEDSWTRELEELLINMTRKAMADCTKDEFVAFMSIISGLKISKLVSGQQLIVDIINDQIDLETIDVSYCFFQLFSPFSTFSQLFPLTDQRCGNLRQAPDVCEVRKSVLFAIRGGEFIRDFFLPSSFA